MGGPREKKLLVRFSSNRFELPRLGSNEGDASKAVCLDDASMVRWFKAWGDTQGGVQVSHPSQALQTLGILHFQGVTEGVTTRNRVSRQLVEG
jgi:hypothetical protein